MKQVKQRLRRSLAMLMAICLSFGMAGQFKTAAIAEASDVKVFTLADAGIGDGTYSNTSQPGQYSRDGMTTLDGTVIHTNITFHGSGAQFRFGGAQTGGWYGLQLYTDFAAGDTSLYLCDAVLGAVGSSDKGWYYTFDPTVAGTPLVGFEFNLKISIQFVDDDNDGSKNDVKLGFYFNDRLYDGQYIILKDYGDQTDAFNGDYMLVYAPDGASVQVSAPAATSADPNLKPLTIHDFGIADETYTTSTAGNCGTISNLNGTLFETDVTFGSGAQLRLGGTNTEGYYGLQIYADETYLYICSAHLGAVGSDNKGWYRWFGPDVAGTPLVGTEFNLKISTRYVDNDGDGQINDVELGFWFNNRLYNNQYIIFKDYLDEGDYSMTGNYIGVFPSSPIKLSAPKASEEELAKDYTTMTLWDYGVENGETTSADGGLVAQNMEITSFDKVAFTAELKFAESTGLRFGGYYEGETDKTWYGIGLACDSNGYLNLEDLFGCNNTAAPLYSGKDIRSGYIKVSMYFDYVGENSKDLQVKYYIDGQFRGTYLYPGIADTIGNYLVLYSLNADAALSYRSVGEKDVDGQGAVSYDLSKGNYLVTDKAAVVKDAAGTALPVTTGGELSTPGDYIIEGTAENTNYQKSIILFKPGDVNLNGTTGEMADLATLQSMIDGAEAAEAAKKGADLNHDGVVSDADLVLMQQIVNGDTTLEEVKKKYYVPALTYDFLGGDEVMPIAGFYGPTRREDTMADFLTDEAFQLVKDSGVNLINYAWKDWVESETDIKDTLALAEKYGIGYFINDARLNTKIDISNNITEDAEPLSSAAVAEYLSDYSYYQSFLGTHVKDEPFEDSDNWQDYHVIQRLGQLKYYQDIARTLNTYVNTNGYINMHPSGALFSKEGTSYSQFWDDYIRKTSPQVLVYDDYPFNDSVSEGAENAKTYFTSLSVVRQKAIENELPFWVHVQAGGDFKEDTTTETELIATEEETYWNVNTSLAFGAKGVAWFPLIQPEYFANTDSGNEYYERNGLIGANGEVTKFYSWAQKANQQIAAVDNVLMKAQSKGVIATGGYAASQTAGLEGMITGTAKLKGVSAEAGNGYGALVGCFDYKDTEAYYVVNYDVTADASQTITLQFNQKYNYHYVKNGIAVEGLKGDSCAVSIPSGEAVLVVLDSVWEPEIWEEEGDWDPIEITHTDFYNPTTGEYLEDGTRRLPDLNASTLVDYGKYTSRVTGGTVPDTLDGTIFSTDVLFHGFAAGLRYGGTQAGGWFGVDVKPDADGNLLVSWQGSVNTSTVTLSPADFQMDSFLDKEFNLKIQFEKSDCVDQDSVKDDLEIRIYVNDLLATKLEYQDFAENLGAYMGIYVSDLESYVVLKTPAPDLNAYHAITTSDIGIADTYNPADVSGTYSGDSMDKVLFTANLDFKKDTNNCICFAGPDENQWASLRFILNSDGNMVVDSAAALNYGIASDWQYAILEELFHLQVTTEYVDLDRDGYRDDVKIGIWINGEMQQGYLYFVDLAPGTGNHILFHAKYSGYINKRTQYEAFTIKAAPLAKTRGEAVYDLTDAKSYTVPETGESLNEPGDYTIHYTKAGTDYTGDVTLYYEGDANLDAVTDVRDLVRMKRGYKEVTLTDLTFPWGKTDSNGTVVEDLYGSLEGVDTLDGVAVTAYVAFPQNDGTSVLRLGGGTSWWNGLSVSHVTVPNRGDALEFKWIEDDSTAYVYESDLGETLHSRPIKLRLAFNCVGEDVQVHVYINDRYAETIVAEGQKDNLGTYCLVYTPSKAMQIASTEEKAARAESVDIDNNGKEEENDIVQLRRLLVGGKVEKETVFGVVSDTHFSGNGTDLERQERFEKALNYYKKNGAEVIIMNADLADLGGTEAYKVLVDIVNEVYADTPAQERPQFITTADNHEYFDSWTWLYTGSDTDAALPLDTVKERFSENLKELDTLLEGTSLNSSRVVNGYTFIGVSEDELGAGPAIYDQATLDWLDTELEKAAAADPNKPIFVAIHQPPRGTVPGSYSAGGVTGYDSVLAKYPQVVLFSSHTHAPLEDEHSIYQNQYTVVNTGSLYYVGIEDDWQGNQVSFENVIDVEKTPEIMNFAQALLVRASGKRVEIERCSFLEDTVSLIKDKWIIEDATDKDTFAYTSSRFETLKEKPVFADGAAATVKWSDAGYVLTFPAATHSDYVYYYKISVDGNTYYYTTDFYQGIGQMKDVCEFPLRNVTSYQIIEIRAVDAYGNESDAITVVK